jgi:hypothetical protein
MSAGAVVGMVYGAGVGYFGGQKNSKLYSSIKFPAPLNAFAQKIGGYAYRKSNNNTDYAYMADGATSGLVLGSIITGTFVTGYYMYSKAFPTKPKKPKSDAPQHEDSSQPQPVPAH